MCDYYDIEEILYEDERIPCTFSVDAMNLGYLDPSRQEDDIASGTKVDLPLWMATSLADRGMVEVRNPVNFDVGVRNALKADPGSVNLRVRNPYYYEVGMDLCTLVGASELARDLPGILRKVLAVRFNDIFDRSMNSPNEDTTMLTQDLTNLERELFESGHQSASRLFKWKTRKLTRLSTARVFRRGMKRRRAGL